MPVRGIEIKDDGVCAKIIVDGQEIHRLSGYTIERNVGEIPLVELRMVCPNEMYLGECAEILIDNSETMARLFNREQFDDFCRLWEEYHERREGQEGNNRED